MLVLVGCNESVPKIITSGSSRSFDYANFSADPLHPAVFAGGDADNAPKNTPSDIESAVLSPDTKDTIFGNRDNCKMLSKLNRRIAEWGWLDNPDITADNNLAVYVAEKSYLRFFSNYCLSYDNFFNEKVEEKTTNSIDYGKIKYLKSDDLTITNNVDSAVYSFLLNETVRTNPNKLVRYSLSQKAGQTSNNYYETLNYTHNTSTNKKLYIALRLLVDKAHSESSVLGLPMFFHMESYALNRSRDSTGDNTQDVFDLLKFRLSRLDRSTDVTSISNRQIMIEGTLVAHETYGTYIASASSCVKQDVTSLSEVITGCPADSVDGSVAVSNSAVAQWYDRLGQPYESQANYEQSRYGSVATAAKLKDSESRNASNLERLWYDFSTDTLSDFFQTSRPTNFFSSSSK